MKAGFRGVRKVRVTVRTDGRLVVSRLLERGAVLSRKAPAGVYGVRVTAPANVRVTLRLGRYQRIA